MPPLLCCQCISHGSLSRRGQANGWRPCKACARGAKRHADCARTASQLVVCSNRHAFPATFCLLSRRPRSNRLAGGTGFWASSTSSACERASARTAHSRPREAAGCARCAGAPQGRTPRRADARRSAATALPLEPAASACNRPRSRIHAFELLRDASIAVTALTPEGGARCMHICTHCIHSLGQRSKLTARVSTALDMWLAQCRQRLSPQILFLCWEHMHTHTHTYIRSESARP